jgi:hypothetical protein
MFVSVPTWTVTALSTGNAVTTVQPLQIPHEIRADLELFCE